MFWMNLAPDTSGSVRKIIAAGFQGFAESDVLMNTKT